MSRPLYSHKQEHIPAAIGVENVLKHSSAGASPRATIFDEFSLKDRIGVVSGGNRGLGLEMALALCELGAKIYVVDLPKSPSEEFQAVAKHVAALGENRGLEYISADVTVQDEIWAKVEEGMLTLPCFERSLKAEVILEVGDKEGRMDVCVAAAGESNPSLTRNSAKFSNPATGILNGQEALEYEAKAFEKIIDVNLNGVFYTAQAAGRQMSRFGNGGSIVLIASMSGSITNRVCSSHDM